MLPRTIGPELRALFIARRWLVAMLTTLLTVISLVSALAHWSQLGDVERGAACVAVVLSVSGAILSRNPMYLWLSVAGPFVLVLTALMAPEGSPPWIPMPNVVTYSVAFAIVLVPRRAGVFLVASAPIVLAVVWQGRPTNVVAGALQLNGGWIVVLQILATSAALWAAWTYLQSRAVAADRDFETRERSAAEAVAQQERARIWRDTAARVHESVLNSIRYVLTTETIDSRRLSHELVPVGVAPESTPDEDPRTLDRLLTAILADPIAAGIVRIPMIRVSAILSPEVFAACRAAVVEAAHNALRHGHATRLSLVFDVVSPGVLTIQATDDGTGLPVHVQPGIGTTSILSASLLEVGGSATVSSVGDGGTRVVITAPAQTAEPPSRRRRAPYSPFDRGRLLLSAPLAGACAVGVLFYLLLGPVRPIDQTGGAHFWLAVVCGVAGAIAAVWLVGQQRHPSLLVGLGLVMLPALVPWFLRTAEYGCGEAVNLAAVLNIAGFSVIVISLWSGVLPGIAGVLTWATGILIVAAQVPAGCRQSVMLALVNSLLIIPIAAIVTFVGIRADQRAADRVHAGRRRALLEQSRAETAMDLNATLNVSVEEASSILADLASGQPLDEATRHRLEAVDARIRVAIQVDAAHAGGLAAFAQRAVAAAAEAGSPVLVRAIEPSTDPEPLPLDLERAITEALVGTRTIQPTLQVFTDGSCDYLSAIVDGEGLRASGLAPGAAVPFGGIQVQVLEEMVDSGGESVVRFSILLTRPITSAVGT